MGVGGGQYVCFCHVAGDEAHLSEVGDQRLEAPRVMASERCDGWWIDEDTHCILCGKAAVGGRAAASARRAARGVLRGLWSVLLTHRLTRTGAGEEGEAAQADIGEPAWQERCHNPRRECSRPDIASL